MGNYNPITITQQHLISRWYSCHHCQRIDFIEPIQAPVVSPGLIGSLTRIKNTIEEIPHPL